jgi:hypothetical protein
MELASTYATELIKSLLSVAALTNMHRASGNEEHRRAAADWLPVLESQMAALRRELTRKPE